MHLKTVKKSHLNGERSRLIRTTPCTYETTDTGTKKNCNRRIALKRSAEQLLGWGWGEDLIQSTPATPRP